MSEQLAAASSPEAQAARAYRDPHETSLALLVLGAVVVALMVVPIALPGLPGTAGWLFAEPNGLGLTAVLTMTFGVLWLIFRSRAARHGLKYQRGFGIAAVIGAIMWLPPFFGVFFIAGPFALLGPVLFFAGVGLSNYFLAGWATVVGTLGIFEGFFGITNRLPASLWAGWEHPAIFLGLGILTIATGMVARRLESHRL